MTYAGDHIQALLKRNATSPHIQNAILEYKNLLFLSKELHETHPKEKCSMLNVPIRGNIPLSDKVIVEYHQKTKSSIVEIMKSEKDTTQATCIMELHNLISVKHRLEQLRAGGNAMTDPRPKMGRGNSRDDGLEQPSNPPPSDVAMDTSDKTKKKEALPIPPSLETSTIQGRPMVSMPLIEYQQLIRKLESQQRDIDEMTSRLSRFASNQVTQGNPNIADLSDKNRPTKIGEKFAELYDNEWSEAFEAFKILLKIKDDEEDEPQIIEELLRVVNSAQTFCADVANEQLEHLKQDLAKSVLEVSISPAGGSKREVNQAKSDKALDSSAEKYARNFRKECALRCVPDVIDLYKRTQASHIFDWARGQYPQEIHKYIERCIELVWLMSVQDPPMYVMSADKGDKVRTDMFTYYGIKGKVVRTTVWPAVLLHRDGPIISKGYVLPQAK